MRAAFFLLVLANLLFFVWSAGYLGSADEGREPQRLDNQLNPEKAKVTPLQPPAAAPEPPAAQPAAPTAPAAPAPAAPDTPAAPPPSPSPSSAPVQPQAKAQAACRRIEGVAVKDAAALQKAVQAAGFTAAVLATEERVWWVHIGGLASKALADKKAGELRQFGVTDFQVLPTDAGTYAISLGLFREEASADQYLRSLGRKGVKSARVLAHTRSATTARLEIRGDGEVLAKRLPQWLTTAPGATAAECL